MSNNEKVESVTLTPKGIALGYAIEAGLVESDLTAFNKFWDNFWPSVTPADIAERDCANQTEQSESAK